MSVQNNETEQCLMREVHIYKWAGTKKPLKCIIIKVHA